MKSNELRKLKKVLSLVLAVGLLLSTAPQLVFADTLTENPSKYRYRVYIQNPITGSDDIDLGEFMPGEEIVFSVPNKAGGVKLKSLEHVSDNGLVDSSGKGTKVTVDGNKVTIIPSDKEYEAVGAVNNSRRIGRMGLPYINPAKEPATCSLKVTLDSDGKITDIDEIKGDVGGCYHGLSSEKAKYTKFFKATEFKQSFIGKNYEQVLAMDMRHRKSKDAPENFDKHEDLAKKVGYRDGKFPNTCYFYLLGTAMKNAVLNAMGGSGELSKEGLSEHEITIKNLHSHDCNHYLHIITNKYGRVVSVWDHTREDLGAADGGIRNAGNEKALKSHREGYGYDRFTGLNKDEIEKLDITVDAITGATENMGRMKNAIVNKLASISFENVSLPNKGAGTYEGTGKAYMRSVITPDVPVEYIVLKATKEADSSISGTNKTVMIKNADSLYSRAKYMQGEKVYISCTEKDKTGKPFAYWEVESGPNLGEVELESPVSRNTNFIMGDKDIKLKAVYSVDKPAFFESGEVIEGSKSEIHVTMSEKLSDVAETDVNAQDFGVRVGTETKVVEKYSVNEKKITLKLKDYEIKSGEEITLRYSDEHKVLKTKAGDLPVLSFLKRINNNVESEFEKLTIKSALVKDANKKEIIVETEQSLAENESLNLQDFRVTVAGIQKNISKVKSAQKSLKVYLDEDVAPAWENIELKYTAANKSLKIDGGKPVAEFTKAVENQVQPVKFLPKEATIEKYNPGKIVLLYGKELKTAAEGSKEHLQDFSVKKNNEKVELDSYEIAGKEVILKLKDKALENDKFVLTYKNDNALIQNNDGTEKAENFTDLEVVNKVSDRYVVTINDATGTKEIGKFKKGEIVNIEAVEKGTNDKFFSEWEVVDGDVQIADKKSRKTRFTMGGKGVFVKAKYDAEEPQPLNPPAASGGGRTAESSASSNATTSASATPTPQAPAVTVKNEAAKELVKNITDQAQANNVDKLVENVPATEKKAAIKTLTADTKMKLAAAVLPKFTDVKANDWYSNDLAVVVTMGLVQGTSATTISPAKNVTGQEMMAMLVRSMGKEVTPIAGANWYDAYKGEATTLKLDEGIKFDITKDLTRAEVAALMFRYVKLNEKEAAMADANALANVKDTADIPVEYKDAVAYMFQKGLLKGYEDGSFAPNKTVSRVEVASILARLLAM